MAYDSLEVMEVFDTLEGACKKTYDNMANEFAQIRAGRANPHILDKVLVDYYGTPTPINQMGNVTVSEARVLVVSVWDASALKSVEKAILAANIGITPNNDGKVIRLIFPELTEDRRKELVKQIKKLCEEAKIVLRCHRRDALEAFKKYKKDSVITEDDYDACEKDVEKEITKQIENVDKAAADKEKEVMSV